MLMKITSGVETLILFLVVQIKDIASYTKVNGGRKGVGQPLVNKLAYRGRISVEPPRTAILKGWQGSNDSLLQMRI